MSDPALKALLALYSKYREAYHKRYPGHSENDSEELFIAMVGSNTQAFINKVEKWAAEHKDDG